MANMKYEDMIILADICAEYVRAELSTNTHIKNRAHFSTEEEVIERMRREKKLVCSSFKGHLTEAEVCNLICDNILWDCESAEAESLGHNYSTGLERFTGHLIMAPLDENEDPIDTGFAIFYSKSQRAYSAPKACTKIKICVEWEAYEDGQICRPLFSVESVYPVR